MVRPVQLLERPLFLPFTCAHCGVGGGKDREWFIDLGIDNEIALDLRDQGAVYLCNICIFNFMNEVNSLAARWQEEHGDNGRGIVEPDSSISEFEPSGDESIRTEQPSSHPSEQVVSVPESDDDADGRAPSF